MDNLIKLPKIELELKQTAKGFWYVGSLRINAENTSEFDNLLSYALERVNEKLNELNNISEMPKKDTKDKKNDKEEYLFNVEEQKLFDNLRSLRNLLANKEGLPHYIIFHNSVLKKIVREKPRTKEDLTKIIGEKKFKKYGELIKELMERNPSEVRGL
ncbi:MAG: HRDC domain-containing protein [Candidatus Pacearchaeota archaeon]|nr:HRDC domain-containing protein [Candidatus Pacearchaeota archaeon]